jgi:hypothetical protein
MKRQVSPGYASVISDPVGWKIRISAWPNEFYPLSDIASKVNEA